MAAHEQGKFWEMFDTLYAHQQQLDRASIERYAKDLGLDMRQYRTAVDGHKFKDLIRRDSAQATKLGSNGTPSFFINGRKLEGSQPFEAFKAIIDEELGT